MPPSGDLNKNIMGELKFLKKRERFPLPRTNVQEILYTLLVQGYVSFFDLDYMQGFRARISEIRHEPSVIVTLHVQLQPPESELLRVL